MSPPRYSFEGTRFRDRSQWYAAGGFFDRFRSFLHVDSSVHSTSTLVSPSTFPHRFVAGGENRPRPEPRDSPRLPKRGSYSSSAMTDQLDEVMARTRRSSGAVPRCPQARGTPGGRRRPPLSSPPQVKLVLLGDMGAGKSCLASRWTRVLRSGTSLRTAVGCAVVQLPPRHACCSANRVRPSPRIVQATVRIKYEHLPRPTVVRHRARKRSPTSLV